MKLNKILIILSSLFMWSCTNGFEDLNKDPLAVDKVSPDLVLPNMFYKGFQLGAGDYQMSSLLYSSLYCQYYANTANHFNSDNYVYTNKWADRGFWTSYYKGLLKNLREIEQQLPMYPEYSDMYQIMRIATVIGTMRLTDTFGDIPYFEAGKGNEQTPYDSQKEIYYDIFKELTEAVNLLKQKRPDQLKYGKEDMMYQGDVDKWIKLANSLRLRAALRLSFVDPQKAKSEGEAALKEDLFTSNADNAAVETDKYLDCKGHPVIASCNHNEFRASETIINILTNTSSIEDPRLPLMFAQTEAWVAGESNFRYKGLPNGVPVAELALEEYDNRHNSNVWGYMWGSTWNDEAKGSKAAVPSGLIMKPLVMMNYSEVCFLKAEAAIWGWAGAGNANDNYEAGIRASLEEMRAGTPESYSYTSTDDNTYITTGNVKWNEADGFETKLKKIITQKWIGIYPNSNEAWAEFRRTGYPTLAPIKQCLEASINIANGEFIKKLRYVDNELINNSQNANDASLNGGKGDGVSVRVWWDTARYK